MCGRYVLKLLEILDEEFSIVHRTWNFQPSYNIAPTEPVPVVLDLDGVRTGMMMRWGLIPFFTRGEPPKYSTINATVERIESGPSWRGPWKRGQRCILPASGFYEWHVGPDGRKQPFYIHLADREVFGFAGLWDRSVRPDGTAIDSCAIITLPANDLMAEIHNSKKRMPAILRREDVATWLSGPAPQARQVLTPYPADLMVAYRVGTRVNSPKNDDPQLIEPLP